MNYTKDFVDKIFENMLNAYAYHRIITDEHGKPVDYEFININKSFELMTGLTKEAIIGKKVTEIIHSIKESPFDWIGFYGEVALTGNSNIVEQFEKALNKHYLINAYSPKKGYFITIFEDISKYKIKEKELEKKNEVLTSIYEELAASEEVLINQNEELLAINAALITSEDRLNRSQALAHVGNWELDIATNQIWTSVEILRIYGFDTSKSSFSYDQTQNVVNKEDRIYKDLALKDLIENNGKYDVEFRITNIATGQERIIHSFATLTLDKNGTPAKVLGVVKDITELKQAEQKLIRANEELTSTNEELLASEEELRSQYDEMLSINTYLNVTKERLKKAQALAHVGNWELDLTTKEIWASAEAFRLYGIERVSPLLPLEKVQKAVHPEDRAKLDKALKLLITEDASYDLEFRIKNAMTGEDRIMHSVASLDYGDNGSPRKVLGVLQDITKTKELVIVRKENDEDFSEDVIIRELDIPEFEPEEIEEFVGIEDEGNNYISPGGEDQPSMEDNLGY